MGVTYGRRDIIDEAVSPIPLIAFVWKYPRWMQVSQIKHYPPSDFEPAASDLARFLWPDGSWAQGRQRLLLGNGEVMIASW